MQIGPNEATSNKPVLLLADTGFRNLRADIIGTLRE
jgi:hypothetical protein